MEAEGFEGVFTDSFIRTLELGVLGFCAITLVLVWRLIKAEQGRDGEPRAAILQASYRFMGFSFALAILMGIVQLIEKEQPLVDEAALLAARQEASETAMRLRVEQMRVQDSEQVQAMMEAHQASLQMALDEVQNRLRLAEDDLLAIRSAASPILSARTSIVDRLPESPERDTLQVLVRALKDVLEN